jgi:hypothetical protein
MVDMASAPVTIAMFASFQAQLQAERVVLAAQLSEITTALAAVHAARTVAPAAAAASSPSSSSSSFASAPGPAIPAPHRVGALGAGPDAEAGMRALIEEAMHGDAQPGNRSLDSAVSLLSAHNTRAAAAAPSSWSNPLPSALVPMVAGTPEHSAQLLIDIITGFSKREVKYTSLDALATALDDWAKQAARPPPGSGKPPWTAAELASLHDYKEFVIHQLGPSQPLSAVLAYHKEWIAAVAGGDINMFAHGAYLYAPGLAKAKILLAQPSSRSRGKSERKAAESASGRSSEGQSAKAKAGKHAAGSCTNHPLSTTHTTAECRLK